MTMTENEERKPLFYPGPMRVAEDESTYRTIYASRELIEAGERTMRRMRQEQDEQEMNSWSEWRRQRRTRWHRFMDLTMADLWRWLTRNSHDPK
jgi:hypothetical protein